MNIPNHSYKTLKFFGGNVTSLSAPQQFKGWLCSGVKDKAGKLVYEGDVVKVNGSDIKNVTFVDGVFRVGESTINHLSDGELEVIGHIAEAKL